MIVLEGHPFEWEVASPTGVTVGVFDGVHVGHRRVLNDLVTSAKGDDIMPTVVTFDPHPLAILAPERAPLMLTSIDQRIEQFRLLGVEVVGVLYFPDIRELSPDQFAHQVLADALQARKVIVGADFRFGRDRGGDPRFLSRVGAERGFDVSIVNMFGYLDGVVSSTRIRQLIADGKVEEAGTLLARWYELVGRVGPGDGRGRTIGFPTANIEVPPDRAVPGNGVYAAWVSLDGFEYQAVVNIGTRPTFDTSMKSIKGRTVEAHLLGFEGDLYNRELPVSFVARLRPEQRFESVPDLIAQIQRDTARARELLAGSLQS